MSKASEQLPHVSAGKACEVAFCAIDGMQQFTAGEQVAGLAFLFHVITQQLGLNVSNLLNQSQRRFDDINQPFKREAQALSDYVNGELR